MVGKASVFLAHLSSRTSALRHRVPFAFCSGLFFCGTISLFTISSPTWIWASSKRIRSWHVSAFVAQGNNSFASSRKSTSYKVSMTLNAPSSTEKGETVLQSITATGQLGKPTPSQKNHPLQSLWNGFDHSWVKQLSSETVENRLKSKQITGASDDGTSNNVKRPVFNGHYVPVRPLPLKNPRLVIHSPDMAARLGLTLNNVESEEFLKFFSGDVDSAFANVSDPSQKISTWATPYALSIMGSRYTSNCPFGTGDGYGDGRAITIGEVVTSRRELQDKVGQRYELQLKGAGPTSFCRGADGRAVFRSSLREFLASEAMYYLNVSTTRALSLIISDGVDGDKVNRPWYSDDNTRPALPDVNDSRLAKYSPDERKAIVAQLKAQVKNDPDVMIRESCAITCRVSPSFLRIGHFDLFARRATADTGENSSVKPNIHTMAFKELEQIVWHACFREFPLECYEQHFGKNDIVAATKCILHHSLENISTMVADWIRVGYVQGNFNADNCLIAGRTMDYGPFGFVDEYHPLFAKWTGSGDHFGFMNQPKAALVNYAVLVESLMPVILAYSENTTGAIEYKSELMEKAQSIFQLKLLMVFREKLGFHPKDDSADELWSELEPLLLVTRVDWTLFWRRLTMVLRDFPLYHSSDSSESSMQVEAMFEILNGNDELKQGSSPFYVPLDAEDRDRYLQWIRKWKVALDRSWREEGRSKVLSYEDSSNATALDRMTFANPKYILREWMLVEAYTKASNLPTSMFPLSTSHLADESIIHELFDLIKNPYAEGRDDQDKKYFRRAPDSALNAGGTAFMSCSS